MGLREMSAAGSCAGGGSAPWSPPVPRGPAFSPSKCDLSAVRGHYAMQTSSIWPCAWVCTVGRGRSHLPPTCLPGPAPHPMPSPTPLQPYPTQSCPTPPSPAPPSATYPVMPHPPPTCSGPAPPPLSTYPPLPHLPLPLPSPALPSSHLLSPAPPSLEPVPDRVPGPTLRHLPGTYSPSSWCPGHWTLRHSGRRLVLGWMSLWRSRGFGLYTLTLGAGVTLGTRPEGRGGGRGLEEAARRAPRGRGWRWGRGKSRGAT